MKKKMLSLALALALCLGLTVPAFAAEVKIVQVPAPIVEEYEGKVEYSTDNFYEGLARLWVYGQDGTKTGYIDKTGKVVIPFQYSWAEYSSSMFRPLEAFREGLATVLKDGKFGYIDKTGAEYILLNTTNIHDGIVRLTGFCVNGSEDNSIWAMDAVAFMAGKEIVNGGGKQQI